MSIKAIRLEIVKPYNESDAENVVTWNELGQVLRDVRYACAKAENYAITQRYLWERFKIDYKNQNGVYPNPKDFKEKTDLYSQLTGMFPDIAASIINQTDQVATRKWNNEKKDVLSLKRSLTSFKLEVPIPVHNKSYKIFKINETERENYIIKVNLLSKKSNRQTNYNMLLKVKDNSSKTILNRIIAGELKQKGLQIISNKKKWFCIIPYDFTERNTEVVDGRIMGIDLGIAKAVYYAFNDSYKRGSIDGGEIERFRKSVRARRITIQNQGKYCGDGRIGHGVKRRLKPVKILREKEKNFRNLINHRYARHLVEIAVKNKCAVIQMEDLTGITKDNAFLKDWPYYDLQQKIKEKAAEYGILFKTINPYKTSQRCSRCGYIDRENRPEQSVFVCQNCGYGSLYLCENCNKEQNHSGVCDSCGGKTNLITVNADYNAAKNIATENIEETIKKEMGKEYNPPK